MRIGVRLTPERVYGVSLRGARRNERRCDVAPGAGGLEDALGDVLAKLRLDPRDRAASTITFDVSRLFSPVREKPVTLVRIAPRPPVDAAHAYSGVTIAERAAGTIHVAGGHSNSGEELAEFDEQSLRAQLAGSEPGGRYVATSVGASVNPAHELEANRVLLEHAQPASVVFSHSFHNNSFSVRERTGVMNSSHLAYAGSLATSLATVAAQQVSGARLFVMTNDGGAVPLTALSLKPVHSLYSGPAAEFVGVTAIVGIDDGRIVIRRGDGVSFGEVTSGAPTVVSRSRDCGGELLATRTVHLAKLADGLIGEWMGEPLEVSISDSGVAEFDGPAGTVRTELDLGALGAACSQLVEWSELAVQINNAAEKEQALANAAAKVRARLVSYGAAPSQVRILDCRVVATSYQNPSVVTVRVRGAGGPTPSEVLGMLS